jgi:trans-2,3-dihydro-3-hydroxyanthranilate isomerase
LSQVSAGRVAVCLSLTADDVLVNTHAPQVASVGLPFLVVELASRDTLRRCVPNLGAYKALLPIDGAVSIYAYTREVGPARFATICDLDARMFTPRMTEDPATGGAAAATAALIAEVRGLSELSLYVAQGVDMGRPSILSVKVDTRDDRAEVRVGGKCVSVMEGSFELAGEH